MGTDENDRACREALERVERARAELEAAAEILRGARVDASPRAMRAEQQVTRALGALWGLELLP